MKKTIKILKNLIMIILILLTIQTAVKADVIDEGEEILTEGLWGWYLQGDDAMDINITLGNSGAESSSKQMTERLLGWLQVIGSIISVIALLIIGFRYMFSSLEEKAQLKGVLIYYVVGAVLVFATSNLLSIVYKVITGLSI